MAALKIAVNDYQADRLFDAYRAAEAQGSFKLFLRFDSTLLLCASAGTDTFLALISPTHGPPQTW
jgi:hypothetical protein